MRPAAEGQLSRADRDGTLAGFLKPDLSPAERAVAQVEGWQREDSATSAACDRACLAYT
jgi:hypothetical protein